MQDISLHFNKDSTPKSHIISKIATDSQINLY